MPERVINQWMIYGAYGYTGRLVVEEAVRRGHQPVLAGRDEQQLLDLAGHYRLPYRVFDLSHAHRIRQSLDGIGLVLHCAGPFLRTAAPMREACLDSGVHYLDITGEIDVLEHSYQCHARAREAGVVVISGVGFDVVPTDLLAHLLKQALPQASDLQLAFAGSGGAVSPGTGKTLLLMMPEGGRIRRDGEIVAVPLAWQDRCFDFIDRPRQCMTIPWGDVATAFHSTGIGNIRVYTAVEPGQLAWLRRLRRLARLLAWPPLATWLERQIGRRLTGPDEQARRQERMYLTGIASDDTRQVSIRMQTPEGYHYTVMSALLAVESLLAHKVMPGAYTPSQALDTDLLLSMDGVTIEDPVITEKG